MNRTLRFLFALWIVVAGSTGSPQPCLAESDDMTPVTLRNQTEVHRLIVRLSDVFDGIPAEADHDIAQAPAPGKQVTYDLNVLTRVANKYNLDWKPQSIADHVVIITACARITGDMISGAIVKKIKEINAANGKNSKSTADVVFDNHALEIDLPADRVPDFALNNFDYDPLSKHFHTDLVAQTASGPYSYPITGRITMKRSVPVLARRLEGGTLVGAADLDQIEIPEERLNEGVVSDASQLIGHELRRDTDGGELIHTHDIVPPRYITRGSLITLKIQTPYMTLTAQGKALQDGAQGDVVRVTNTQSNRMVEGTVEGPGVVRVQTAQRLAEAQ